MASALRPRLFALTLFLTLLGAPAFASQRAPAAPEAPLARGIILRFFQTLTLFLEKLGPGMDPLGSPAPQPEGSAPGTEQQEPQGDLGAGMDPLG